MKAFALLKHRNNGSHTSHKKINYSTMKQFNHEAMKQQSNKSNPTTKFSQTKILFLAMGIFIIFFSFVSIWKYNHFLYNGLDLAIFNNVFYNIIHGNGTWSSIQGHNYFGDHFTPIIYLLVPIYFLWQDPRMLLVLQVIFFGLAAWPLFLVSQLILKKSGAAVVISLLWFINPLLHNAALFEWHAISLLPLLFFFLFYFYLRLKDFKPPPARPKARTLGGLGGYKLLSCYLVILLLVLFVREDIAFIVFTFSIIALVDYFRRRQLSIRNYQLLAILSTTILALVYFLVSLKIISHFSPSGASPFAYYYGWMFHVIIPEIIYHILTPVNLAMVVMFLVPFLFIPVVRAKWLWLGVIPLAQIILSAAGGGVVIAKMHYVLLFLPAIFIAFAYSYDQGREWLQKRLKITNILPVLLIAANFYLLFTIGPWPPSQKQLHANSETAQRLIYQIQADDSVAAGYNYLANLSSRKNIYPFHYSYLGVAQFSQTKYEIKKPDYVLINSDDIFDMYYNLSRSSWAGPAYRWGSGWSNLSSPSLYRAEDNVFLFYQGLGQNPPAALTLEMQTTLDLLNQPDGANSESPYRGLGIGKLSTLELIPKEN